MIIKLKFILLLIVLFQSQTLLGKENSQFEQIRYYIEAENISLCEEGILILDGQSLILVKSLCHDGQGFYFWDTDGCGWICNWCGTINPLGTSICKKCGERNGSAHIPHPAEQVAECGMCLCLLVYMIAQRYLRQRLKQAQAFVPNQLGKPTRTPTMRWIFQLFEGVHLLIHRTRKGVEEIVLNMNPVRYHVLAMLGPQFEKIYSGL